MFGIITRPLRDYLRIREATVHSVRHFNGEQIPERDGAHVMHNDDGNW
jgi:hypothetical protein